MQFKLIAIAGRKGHGKDTAAEALIKRGYTNVKFADALKGMCRVMLAADGLDKPTIQRMIDGDLKEEPIAYIEGKFLQKAATLETAQQMVSFLLDYQNQILPAYDEPSPALQDKTPEYASTELLKFLERWRDYPGITPRLIMQELGTEYGRVLLGDAIWTYATQLRIKAVNGPVVITDMRFVNERNIMAGMGALLLRVKRVLLTNGDNDHGLFSNHPSETAIDALEVNHELINDAGIDKLHAHITLAANNQKAGIAKIDIDKNDAIRFPNIMDHPDFRYAQRILSVKPNEEKMRVVYEVQYLAPIIIDRV